MVNKKSFEWTLNQHQTFFNLLENTDLRIFSLTFSSADNEMVSDRPTIIEWGSTGVLLITSLEPISLGCEGYI